MNIITVRTEYGHLCYQHANVRCIFYNLVIEYNNYIHIYWWVLMDLIYNNCYFCNFLILLWAIWGISFVFVYFTSFYAKLKVKFLIISTSLVLWTTCVSSAFDLNKWSAHLTTHTCLYKVVPFFLLGIPIVSVMYAATWSFTEVLVSNCKNITSRLQDKGKILEDTLSNNCHLLNISAQVQLTYSFSHFQVQQKYKLCVYILQLYLFIFQFLNRQTKTSAVVCKINKEMVYYTLIT